jgi:hypothetical protein
LCAVLFPLFDFIPGLRCGSGFLESADLVCMASDLHRYVLVIYLLGLWFSVPPVVHRLPRPVILSQLRALSPFDLQRCSIQFSLRFNCAVE